ncbi:hypothetical protein VUR80DRAFT_3857 [Thermomyces stellatus]
MNHPQLQGTLADKTLIATDPSPRFIRRYGRIKCAVSRSPVVVIVFLEDRATTTPWQCCLQLRVPRTQPPRPPPPLFLPAPPTKTPPAPIPPLYPPRAWQSQVSPFLPNPPMTSFIARILAPNFTTVSRSFRAFSSSSGLALPSMTAPRGTSAGPSTMAKSSPSRSPSQFSDATTSDVVVLTQ